MNYERKKYNPYMVVKTFEDAIANYTNAPYAVSVDNCTNALFLCLQYLKQKNFINMHDLGTFMFDKQILDLNFQQCLLSKIDK